MKKFLPILILVSQSFALQYGYSPVVLGEYYPVSYQHTIQPDRNYKPLEEVKPKPRLNVKLSIPLFKRTMNKSITTIYFDFNSYKVKKIEREKLKNIKGSVILKGYASPEGPEDYNLQLSKKRIKSVKNLLKSVSILKEEALGEKGCNLPKNKWHLCRKVEIIPGGNNARLQGKKGANTNK